MTLPGLLALLIICLIQLYQRVPPYYIAWNSSVVRFPHPGLPLSLWGPLIRSPPTGS